MVLHNYFFILFFTLVAGSGIHREYEDNSSSDLIYLCKSFTLKIIKLFEKNSVTTTFYMWAKINTFSP